MLDGLDINKMFSEAADAAEDTGEKDVSKFGDKIEFEEELLKKNRKNNVEQKKTTKPTLKTTPNKKEEAPKEEKRVENKGLLNTSISINKTYIRRILEMNAVINGYNQTEKEFVLGYFQIEGEEVDIPSVIYGALTAEPSDLKALNIIIKAKEHTPADRAFYLMSLSNDDIGYVHQQIQMLTGELEEIDNINEANKIKVCRMLEKVISNMPKDIFSYIDKLQDFTNKAIS